MIPRFSALHRRRAFHRTAVVVLSMGMLLGIGVVRAADVAPEPAAAVPPPVDVGAVTEAAKPDTVPFDHSIHAGKYRMPCLSCHVDADKSTTAGVPSTAKCMGCHKFVDKQKPAVQELARLWGDDQVPRWTRVYALPDYVYFSHRVHVSAGVDCAKCHGNVASMTRITQVSPLTMGWCLQCHEQERAPRDCVACHK